MIRSSNRALGMAFLALSAASLPFTAAQTGGSFCSTSLCINALVSGQSVTFQLSSTLGFTQLGWMAVGFGQSMINSPMVITWPNIDGTITLSQRQATAHAMPQVVANPAQVAAISWQYSILATNTTTIAFSHPLPASGSLSAVNMVYAYSTFRPPSSSPSADLQKHLSSGTFVMDLTQPQAALPTGSYTSSAFVPTRTNTRVITSTSTSSPQQLVDPPLSPSQKKLVIHGILMSLGFLVFLPLGALLPRYTRSSNAMRNKWFTAHWVNQFLISGPIIFAGWALGYQYVGQGPVSHFSDPHRRAGLALLILYLLQLAGGAFIHFFKPTPKPIALSISAPNSPSEPKVPRSQRYHSEKSQLPYSQAIVSSLKARPPQNYAHAVMGLTLIGLAFYNVREGYRHEWQYGTGRSWTSTLDSVNKWWLAWVIIIPALYVLGLGLLPRQLYKEQVTREMSGLESGSSGTDLVKIDQKIEEVDGTKEGASSLGHSIKMA